MTTAEDTCTDPSCFSGKQSAQAKRLLDAAKESGTPLLKISTKTSHQKLEAPAVEVRKGATVITKVTVKQGQWVEAKEGDCNFTVQALVQDGTEKGSLRWVCPNQNCKIHKHRVERSSDSSSSGGRQESYEAQRARRQAEADRESKVRRMMLDGLEEDDPCNVRQSFIPMLLIELMDDINISEADLCDRLELTFAAPRKGNEWEVEMLRNKAARKVLEAFIDSPDRDISDLHQVAFHMLALRAIDSDVYLDMDAEMKMAHRIVVRAGFDPKATEADARKRLDKEEEQASAAVAETPTPAAPAKSAAKKAAKKAAAKVGA